MAESFAGLGRRASEKLRLPPHSVEAERSVLGGLMLDQRAWDQIADAVEASDFYRADHRLIFTAIATLIERDQPPDAITVGELLARQGELDAAGGLDYLAQLVEETPSAANIRAYARIVRERAMLRQLIEIGGDIAASAHEESGRTVEELVDLAEQRVFEIADRGQRRGSGFIALKHILPKTIDRLDVLSHSDGDITGISTGFGDMDRMTAGLQRGDLIIIAGRPSMGKCIVSGSRILDPSSGRLESIDDRVRERRGALVSVDRRGRLRPANASAFVDDGVKPVYEVRTALGRRIAVTASHPFLTMRGWQPLAALRENVHIGVPRVLPFFGKRALPDALVKLTAYILADGGVPGDGIASERRGFGERLWAWLSALRLSPTAVATAAVAGVQGSAGAAALARPIARGFDSARTSDDASHLGTRDDPLTRWLAALRAGGRSAHDKRVPDVVFELPREQLGLFLNRLFACDGRIDVRNGSEVAISYATASERLARDVQHLLLRFGVISKLCCPDAADLGAEQRGYELRIEAPRDIARFVREIGIFGKEAAADAALRATARTAPDDDADVVPTEVWELIEARKHGLPWSAIGRVLGLPEGTDPFVGKCGLSRATLARIADALGDDELRNLAAGDIYWDRIDAIRYIGPRQVYDLTVPEHHNFVAEDVIVHNTTFAMNIAENAAIGANVPVAVFSMEMSAEQLSFRMIGSIGRVNQGHLRTGRLTDEDWSRIESAVSMMSNAPIFIDDSAGLTPTDVRARARRLKREQGLGLVVVDYLQLMQVSGTTENRATEISEISRSLKALAKELDVPVIALSQLNRSVEQRTDKKPVMSDLRECVTGETLAWLADGRRVPVRDLVGSTPDMRSIDAKRRVTRARADKVWCVGARPVFRVQLAGGRSIRATAEHRLMADVGWKTISELGVGDRIAVIPDVPQPTSADSGSPQDSAPSAESDLSWDRVAAILPDGEEEVFDLTVPGPANWLADGIVTHNSGAIEQDADLIVFIYREEVYDPDTPRKGIADIIIAKQRNGPVGEFHLTFLGEFTKFENLVAEAYGEGVF